VMIFFRVLLDTNDTILIDSKIARQLSLGPEAVNCTLICGVLRVSASASLSLDSVSVVIVSVTTAPPPPRCLGDTVLWCSSDGLCSHYLKVTPRGVQNEQDVPPRHRCRVKSHIVKLLLRQQPRVLDDRFRLSIVRTSAVSLARHDTTIRDYRSEVTPTAHMVSSTLADLLECFALCSFRLRSRE
jgi:hypothetical protein